MPQENGKSNSFDVGRQQVGRVYALALLRAAEKEGKADEIATELDSLIADVLDRLPDLDATLASPRVAHDDMCLLLEKAFASRMSRALLNFLKVVSSHGRLNCLREINQQARTLLNETMGRVEVSVTTAEPINGQLLKNVGEQLRGAMRSEIDLQTRVDDDLIGGVVVRVGDTVYDGSIANRFERLRDKALQKTAEEIRQSVERFTSK